MKIKNWDKFQHFKEGSRNILWIKLYRELMDDLDWHELAGEDAKALVMLWLIASESNGYLPDIKKISFRLRRTVESTKELLSRLNHWLIQDDIKLISNGYQPDALEKRRIEEKEVAANAAPSADAPKAPVVQLTDKRGARLPADWAPGPADLEFARNEGMEPRQIDREAGRFRDYWSAQPGQRGVKLDWQATWRNWLRNSKDKFGGLAAKPMPAKTWID